MQKFLAFVIAFSTACYGKSINYEEESGCLTKGFVMKEDQRCYMIFGEELFTRKDAAKLCSDLNSYLPSIENDNQNSLIIKLSGNNHKSFWIGLSCVNDSSCAWDEGTVLTNYRNFFNNSANSLDGGCYYNNIEDLNVNSFGQWYSEPCGTTKHHVICQQLSTTNVIQKCAEYFTRNTANDACYRFINDKKTFVEANDECQKQQAQLVSIHSNDDNNYILNLVQINKDNMNVWIGLEYEGSQSKWLDNSTFGEFNKYKEGFPSNELGRAVKMITSKTEDQGSWENGNEGEKLAFVCKLKAEVTTNSLSPAEIKT
uniref:C-type lectin domain-containing protein n=1 Tax=Rhabditophanes sp. KR3021 TaxID=114890 RepID=A0AC35U8G3_9BILA